ncbi:MAG: iron-sulfur cluster assembly protein [bacterium]
MENKETKLKERVIKALQGVIDPETCQSIWEMKLVRHVQIKEGRGVELVFRPSSRTCPLAFALGAEIKAALIKVAGVETVSIKVENFHRAAELEQILGQGSN